MDKVTLYNLLIKLKPSTLRLFLGMYSLSEDTGEVQTSFNDLKDRLGMAKTTTSRGMQELEKLGILEIKLNKGLPSEYRLNIPDEFRKDNRY